MRKWLRAFEVSGVDADDLVQEVLTVVSQELPKFIHYERVGGIPKLAAKNTLPSTANLLAGQEAISACQGWQQFARATPST
jgi:hypothetical protein